MEARSINLGRCNNKYIIMDIFLTAAELDARNETERLLWACSARHRQFLTKNLSWYPDALKFNILWESIKD